MGGGVDALSTIRGLQPSRALVASLMRTPATLTRTDWVELAVLVGSATPPSGPARYSAATELAARRACYLGLCNACDLSVENVPSTGRRRFSVYDIHVRPESVDEFVQRLRPAVALLQRGQRWLDDAPEPDPLARALWRAQLLANGAGVTRQSGTIAIRTFTSTRISALLASASVLGLPVTRSTGQRKERANRLTVRVDDLASLTSPSHAGAP